MMTSLRQVGAQLRARRLERQRHDPSFTLVYLCDAIGLPPCELLALERGVAVKLDAKTRHLLAELLEMDPALLSAIPATAWDEDASWQAHESFGAHVKARREELRKTDRRYGLRQVAERVGLPPAYLSNIEHGKKGAPNEDAICALADELDEDPDVLLAMAGKLASDVRGIVLRRPKLFSQLIRSLAHRTDEEIHLALQAFDEPKQRARALARETLGILESGHYLDPLGQQVEIGAMLQQAVAHTHTHAPEDFAHRQFKGFNTRARRMRIDVRQVPTLQAMQTLADRPPRSVLVLNFADAHEPGGNFLSGGRGQEQTLMGATGLLSCLRQQRAFYQQHQDRDPFYSDHLIYAPAVPVFRDTDGRLLARPYSCAFISATAINARIVEQRAPQRRDEITESMSRRMHKVLRCAQAYGHDHLILGAWGCGSFGNSPRLVARLFFDALQQEFQGAFRSVVFAVRDQATAEIFREQFQPVALVDDLPLFLQMKMAPQAPKARQYDAKRTLSLADGTACLDTFQAAPDFEPVEPGDTEPSASMLAQARDTYRELRIRVWREATRPDTSDTDARRRYRDNQARFRSMVMSICERANLAYYRSPTPEARTQLWHHLWTKTRYSGIRAQIATTEVADLTPLFDDYRWFSDACWDLENKGHDIVRAGPCVTDFIHRTGPFAGKQTVANIPKLQKLISVARAFKHYFELYPNEMALSFVTGDLPCDAQAVWKILKRLDQQGYRGDLTSLHLLMDLGFPVIKPDIVLARLFLQLGWLHAALPNLPSDLAEADLRGSGQYKTSYLYTKPTLYQPMIVFANRLVAGLDADVLERDIGWVSSNPLREFDLFTVKAGQLPEDAFGIERTLYPSA